MRNRWEARWDLFQGAEREKNPGRLGSVARKASRVLEDGGRGGIQRPFENLWKLPATCSTSSGWWMDLMCVRMH